MNLSVTPDLSTLTGDTLRPITRAEYLRMNELGFFEDERVELLCGVLVKKMTTGPRHMFSVDELIERLVMALGKRARVSPGRPLPADDYSMPEPDILVFDRGDYSEHPGPERALLLIEVSDSSLPRDRRIKLPLYAACGVREYWIVNLVDDAIEVYRDPRDGEYRERFVARPGETLAPLAFPDVELPVGEIIPPK